MEEVVFRDGAGGDAFGRVVCEGAVFLEEAAVGGGLGHVGRVVWASDGFYGEEAREEKRKDWSWRWRVGVWLEIGSLRSRNRSRGGRAARPDSCGGVEVRSTFRVLGDLGSTRHFWNGRCDQ